MKSMFEAKRLAAALRLRRLAYQCPDGTWRRLDEHRYVPERQRTGSPIGVCQLRC